MKTNRSHSQSVTDSHSGTADSQTVCIVGLGYVGLPIAVEFDCGGHTVIGFDVDSEKVRQLTDGCDPTGDVGDDLVADCTVEFTTDQSTMSEADYIIIAVPTPVDDLKNPNLRFVESAGELVGTHITEETIVVLESTVYPGATREILGPAIESTSEFIAGEEFALGYSPERLVPGDDEHGFRNVVKIVSGQDDETLAAVASLYESVVEAGVHRAPEIEVAETAKCIENIQRDLNIALVNELAITCNNLGLDTHAVLDAAGTKWNFHDYRPGLVGGHCIPVDPFYIIYESKRNGFSPTLIEEGREVNEYMPKHIGKETLKGLNDCGNVLRESTVLVLGLAYKPNVGDIRTSAVGGTIDKLQSYGVDVVGYDPHAEADAVVEAFDITVREELVFDGVDGILLATPHDEFLNIDFDAAVAGLVDEPLLIDVMGIFHPEQFVESPIQYKRI
jgi:UDP-N-acetyl-D-galactosamine dehydrogenase